MFKIQKTKYHEWTRWFAWRPVTTIDDQLVWLTFVQRKWEQPKIYGIPPFIIYRTK